MANLGTLDRMGYGYGFGTDASDTFNKYMARQIATKGSDWDKLLYLIGGAAGNAMRVNREGREGKKLDKIIADAKAPGVEYAGNENGVGIGGMTPEQQQAFQNEQAAATAMAQAPQDANAMLRVGTASPEQSAYYDNILSRMANGSGAGGFVERPTNNGMNNYNWDYVMQQARDQGISNKILDARKADIQSDISKQADAAYLPEIQKDLYGYTDEEGNRIAPTTDSRLRAMAKIEELKKYSPETAKAWQTLAVNGMQGDVNQAYKKELTQMQIDAANARTDKTLAARNALANAKTAATMTPANYLKTMGYSSITDLNKAIDAFKVVDDTRTGPNGEVMYKPLGDQQKGELKKLMEIKKNYDGLVAGYGSNPNVGNPGGGNPNKGNPNVGNPGGKELSAKDYINNIVKATNFSSYDGDEGEGKYNFNTGTQAIVDYLRKGGKNDKDIYTFVDGILADAEKAGELPAGYRQSFAHSMGVKTQQDVIDEGLKEAENKRLGTVDENGHRNKFTEWDLSPAVAAIRDEYFNDQTAAQQKYGFRTYHDYVDWLMKYGE